MSLLLTSDMYRVYGLYKVQRNLVISMVYARTMTTVNGQRCSLYCDLCTRSALIGHARATVAWRRGFTKMFSFKTISKLHVTQAVHIALLAYIIHRHAY